MDTGSKSTAQVTKEYQYHEGKMIFYRRLLRSHWDIYYCQAMYDAMKQMERIAYA